MARRRRASTGGLEGILLLIIGGILSAVVAAVEFFSRYVEVFVAIGIFTVTAIILFGVRKKVVNKKRRELLREVLDVLQLNNIDSQLKEYDDRLIVKSRQALSAYSDLKYFKERENFESVRMVSEARNAIHNTIHTFLDSNDYESRKQYDYVKDELLAYLEMADGYRVKVVYISSAGNNLGERIVHITAARIDEIACHPELLMSKGEYIKLLKSQEKQELDILKHRYYERVNDVIESANVAKKSLIVKAQANNLDELIQRLFDRTVNSIQKVKTLDSDEWRMIERYIDACNDEIQQIVLDDRRIRDYYDSDDFSKLKQTCDALVQSQKEFNEYVDEKAAAVTKLFGTRVVRNETQNEDAYNYIRAYKKTINPFTAEVSSHVFGSAENNPIGYIVKYFYPSKSQYKDQIEKLQILIGELETLREAKVIIDNYKKDYEQYIHNVPAYVLDNDNDGFYSRLGLAIIDEAALNVEYRFTYTSDGGMAQRSFAIPMNEENITELINHLASRLSLDALVKEQRAMMTAKLRTQIKERDNFTCCQCGNSVRAEPNLLLEIDHIIPISKGGLTREENLQTLCWKCNRSKGARMVFSRT